MSRILAIDPGPDRSAWLELVDGERIAMRAIAANRDLLLALRAGVAGGRTLVIEKVESFGMAVGAEVFETVFWSGRFAEAAGDRVETVRLPRRAVKLNLCGSARAKDPNVRRALIDRFGGDAAIGRKANPGPLYGITADLWAALAVAVTYYDQAGAA